MAGRPWKSSDSEDTKEEGRTGGREKKKEKLLFKRSFGRLPPSEQWGWHQRADLSGGVCSPCTATDRQTQTERVFNWSDSFRDFQDDSPSPFVDKDAKGGSDSRKEPRQGVQRLATGPANPMPLVYCGKYTVHPFAFHILLTPCKCEHLLFPPDGFVSYVRSFPSIRSGDPLVSMSHFLSNS